LAQLVNVLQAPILTEGARMLLTPTFHVFEMYAAHQGARAVRLTIETGPIAFAAGDQRMTIANLSGSASIGDNGLTLSIVNPHASLPCDAQIELRGARHVEIETRLLRDQELTAHNT